LAECHTHRNKWLDRRSKMYKLFIGFRKLGEFNSILEAKQLAENSGLNGIFTLIGYSYRDSWYNSEKNIKTINNHETGNQAKRNSNFKQ
jgi:hypothetical protein